MPCITRVVKVKTVVVDRIEEPVAGVTVVLNWRRQRRVLPRSSRRRFKGTHRPNQNSLRIRAGQMAAPCTSCLDPPMFTP